MAKHKRWDELSPLAKVAIVKLAVIDIGMRTWALVDVAHRRPDRIKGSKTGWVVALTLVNSAGVLPAAYLLLARKPD
ncbi:MAG: DUF5652 family protein [Actinobacteria bacterium]|nr:DUF5652 family protein [Actinomycetota bacterium]